jgi:hypothetical protein
LVYDVELLLSIVIDAVSFPEWQISELRVLWSDIPEAKNNK